jgi:enamine deaminase RidA (YjgF/YER057c/UK114 family)
MSKAHINPDGLIKNEGFSQVVKATGSTTIYIAGQGAFDGDGQLVGEDDYRAQTIKVFQNLALALDAAGASPADVVSSTMYVKNLDNDSVRAFVSGMMSSLEGTPFPPNASTLVGVQALADPRMLVEVSAIAVVE